MVALMECLFSENLMANLMISENRIITLGDLQKSLAYRFRNPFLLEQALTHKSYSNENNVNFNNERFEYLGDSVIDLIVSDYTIRKYLEFKEGILSKIRAAVVNEQCLAELARTISLGSYLLLGKGEENSGGRLKNSILANAFEAVAGAVYFDSNHEITFKVFLPFLQPNIDKYAETTRFRDYKSELQEYTQDKYSCMPSYKIIKAIGPDHDKTFHVTVMIQRQVSGEGKGRTKKEAEQAAAHSALEELESLFSD